jgi:hypothetical protein
VSRFRPGKDWMVPKRSHRSLSGPSTYVPEHRYNTSHTRVVKVHPN